MYLQFFKMQRNKKKKSKESFIQMFCLEWQRTEKHFEVKWLTLLSDTWKTYKNIAGLENRRKRINDDTAYCLALVIYFMD